jgi:hypothetical protein
VERGFLANKPGPLMNISPDKYFGINRFSFPDQTLNTG